MSKHSLINNQDGFLIPTTLVLVGALAIMGVLVVKDAGIESSVGRNYSIQKQSESAAEYSAKETIAHINEIFIDPVNPTSTEVIFDLGALPWKPEDGYNTKFDFELHRWGEADFYNHRSSQAEGLDYIDEANTIFVLVDQSSSTPTYGLAGTHVPDYFVYDIYSRVRHAAVGNSEVAILVGYLQIKD